MPLVSKTFSQIITFTRASSATYFDAAGVLQTATTDVPRFDYNPSTLAALGLLIEESRTNSIRNNTMQGAVAGTPGTAPTNWVFSTGAGITRELVGTGTENGVTYVDYRFSGTGSVDSDTIFEQATQIAALSGQVWSASQFLKLQSGSLTNVTLTLIVTEHSAAGAFLAAFTQNQTITAASLASQRYVLTRTLTNASTAFVRSGVRITSAGAIDITLRIGLPQLEQGAFATSVIPTTTTAVTRAADVASVNTLSPWFNAVEGTIYTEFALTLPASGGNQFLTRFSDNNYNNSVANNVASTGFAQIVTASGGVFDGVASTAVAVTANTVTKFAAAYAANDLAACKDGGAVATDSTATIPSGLTRFDLGSDHIGLNRVKAGHLRRITYYPRKFSSAELQSITT